MKKGSAKISWKIVCILKDEAGLEILNLKTWNEALLSRQIWKLFTAKVSLWVDWVKSTILENKLYGCLKARI